MFPQCDYRDFGRTAVQEKVCLFPHLSPPSALPKTAHNPGDCPPQSLLQFHSLLRKLLLLGDQSLLPLQPCQLGWKWSGATEKT